MKVFSFLFVFLILWGGATYLGNKWYEQEGEAALQESLYAVLRAHEVADPRVELTKLDASISGTLETAAAYELLTAKLQEIKGVRLREEENQLKVQGYLKLEKVDQTVLVEGAISRFESLKPFDEELTYQKGNRLREDSLYQDPAPLAKDALQTELRKFFSYQGRKAVELRGHNVVLSGSITEVLRHSLLSNLRQQGLEVEDELTLVDPLPAQFTIARIGSNYRGEGRVPLSFDPAHLGLTALEGLHYDSYTEASNQLDNPAFAQWVQSFFSQEGDREFQLTGSSLHLRGEGTPAASAQWKQEAETLGYQVNNDLTLYPSLYHFPSYLIDSQTTGGFIKRFQKAAQSVVLQFSRPQQDLTTERGLQTLLVIMTSSSPAARYLLGYYHQGEALSEVEKAQILSPFASQGIAASRFEWVPLEPVEPSGSNHSHLLDPTLVSLELLLK